MTTTTGSLSLLSDETLDENPSPSIPDFLAPPATTQADDQQHQQQQQADVIDEEREQARAMMVVEDRLTRLMKVLEELESGGDERHLLRLCSMGVSSTEFTSEIQRLEQNARDLCVMEQKELERSKSLMVLSSPNHNSV